MNQHQTDTKPYSLRKSRSVMKWIYSCYKKKGKDLPQNELSQLEKDLSELDEALLQKKTDEASQLAKKLEEFGKTRCKKSFFHYALEFIFALAMALIIATIVRQMWFEFYEIPTGSMRPTFREQDHLTVTKTAFGINVPLKTCHWYFDPNLVQRTSILIFSAEGLPLEDTETTYFGIIPYTKRYIKRCIGKPGDTIYFYGGRLYGIDKEGRDLAELRESPWMENLEYVPFLSFEGQTQVEGNTTIFQQMHKSIGRVNMLRNGTFNAEVFNGKEWVKDQPLAQKAPHEQIETYSDFFGMRNYAMVRLLTREQLEKTPGVNAKEIEDGVLYLQMHHTPSLTFPKPVVLKERIGHALWIGSYNTFIPLQQKHLDTLMDNLYTARFVVQNGKATRYNVNDQRFPPGSPAFPGIPDGTYEFYHGKAEKIHWQGISTDISPDNPLYSHQPANIQKLFNLGMEMNVVYDPYPQNQILFPHRYAYFRDGDLYIMGTKVMNKDDPALIAFQASEAKKEKQSTAEKPYIAFKDYGPPIKDGKIDQQFMKAFGLTIPEKNYFVLGDNHAMSSDSRVFGFVPQANLQGAPSIIIWPPGERLGRPAQKPYPIFNVPRTIIWSIAALILGIWYLIYRRNLNRPIFKKQTWKK